MAVLRTTTAAQLLLALSQLAAAVPTAYVDANSTDIPTLGAVASESSVCSKIGISLLEQGGNAIDALVGTTFCVGVVGMYHSGIGGGGFMLIRDSQGEFEFVDFREVASSTYFEDMYVNDSSLSLYGGLAV